MRLEALRRLRLRSPGQAPAAARAYRESTHAPQWGIGWGPKIIRHLGPKKYAGPLRYSIVKIDRAMYRVTRGRYLSSGMARIPTLILLVESPQGARVLVPLQYVDIDSAIYVVGTNWGRPKHPRWTGWLLDAGRCAVNIRGDETPARAELVAGTDRTALWPRIVHASAYYGRCERIAGRQLRVFRINIVD